MFQQTTDYGQQTTDKLQFDEVNSQWSMINDLRHLVQLLDNREDEDSSEQADCHQRAPNDGEVHAPHVSRNA